MNSVEIKKSSIVKFIYETVPKVAPALRLFQFSLQGAMTRRRRHEYTK